MAPSVFKVSTSDSPLETLEAQALGGDFEAGASARGGLEKQIDDHAAAELIGFLGVALARLKALGAIEDAFDLHSIQRLDSQQSAT
jgi:hypothetical protein